MQSVQLEEKFIWEAWAIIYQKIIGSRGEQIIMIPKYVFDQISKNNEISSSSSLLGLSMFVP